MNISYTEEGGIQISALRGTELIQRTYFGISIFEATQLFCEMYRGEG